MLRYKIHTENPHQRALNHAKDILEEGGIIIYPTDTYYGLGCNVYHKKALEKLYWLKGKSKFDPVSLIVADMQQASQFAKISNHVFRIMKHCLPGPYTFILPATREIPKIMLSKRKEVGIRIPDCTVSHALIETLGKPLINTSINMFGVGAMLDPDAIEQHYDSQVDLFLDAGWLEDYEESTVVSLIDDEMEILREGKGSLENLYI